MNDLVKRLEELTCEHRELIKELSYENRRLESLTIKQREPIKELIHENRQLKLKTQLLWNRVQDLKLKTQLLWNRIQYLEKTNLVIDREIAEIPIDLDLIPESDLNRH